MTKFWNFGRWKSSRAFSWPASSACSFSYFCTLKNACQPSISPWKKRRAAKIWEFFLQNADYCFDTRLQNWIGPNQEKALRFFRYTHKSKIQTNLLIKLRIIFRFKEKKQRKCFGVCHYIPVLLAEKENQPEFLATGIPPFGKTSLFYFIFEKCSLKNFLKQFWKVEIIKGFFLTGVFCLFIWAFLSSQDSMLTIHLAMEKTTNSKDMRIFPSKRRSLLWYKTVELISAKSRESPSHAQKQNPDKPFN